MKKLLTAAVFLAAILIVAGACYASEGMEVNDANFNDQVLKADKMVMVDFWAPWCGPCRAMAPSVEKAAREYSGKMIVKKMNVDKNQVWAKKFKIQGIPCLIFFKNGKEVNRLVGSRPYPQLKTEIDKILK